MGQQRYCEGCGGRFTDRYAYRDTKFCSTSCYLSKRWGNKGRCIECGDASATRFCSKSCFYRFHGRRVVLKAREDRLEIIATLGGKCVLCGFSDPRALDIDHVDRQRKLRMKSYPLKRRVSDWRKNMAHLRLLCANCHRIDTTEAVWNKQRVRF